MSTNNPVDKKKVIFVSHTHWDREWYVTEEKFKMMLLELVDRVIDMLLTDPEYNCFMLDGQTVMLEDYLQICPEKESIIRDFVESGRLIIGPWYVLPDEYLISGEGHIRNYLYGDKVCSRFNAKMNRGYLPDSFGHPSQMPQILKGLGMNEIIFWRGLGPEITETEFIWKGIDGSELVGINMPYSYGIGACLPDTTKPFLKRVEKIIDRLAPLTKNKAILVMQGVDHVAPMREFPSLLKEANSALADYELIQGSLDDYLNEIDTAQITQTTEGELRSGYKAYLLGGTLSARAYLKQANEQVETELIGYAEPLSLFAAVMCGTEYPRNQIDHAWRSYLRNMPHDSICGCSIDAVHEEMMIRFRNLEIINKHLIKNAVEKISEQLMVMNPGSVEDSSLELSADGQFVVYNPLFWKRNDVVRVMLCFEENLLRKVNYDTGELEEFCPVYSDKLPNSLTIIDPAGHEFQGNIIEWLDDDEMKLSLDTQPEMNQTRNAVIEFIAIDALPLSTALYSYKWEFDASTLESDLDFKAGISVIENDHYQIRVKLEDGSLVLRDKESNLEFINFLSYSDSGDAGDEYTYSPPAKDSLCISRIVAAEIHGNTENSLSVLSEILIPESLSDDRQKRSENLVPTQVETLFQLHPGSRRLDITVNVDNRSKDHRLRMQLHTGIMSDYSYADGIFSIDKRRNSDVKHDYRNWIESPNTNPHKTFVTVAAKDAAFTLINKGVPEYEVFQNSEGVSIIALTLIRSVGWLSRPDLLSRKGNGGWTIPTPDAQCEGKSTIECAITLGKCWNPGKIARQAEAFTRPLAAFSCKKRDERKVLRRRDNCVVESMSLFSLETEGIIVSSIKQSEKGGGIVLRCTNITDQPIKALLVFRISLSNAAKGNLAETVWESLEIDEDSLRFTVMPMEIATILLEYNEAND
jgi:2-O-(6-phospho-alpha-D-mannosyl)-D-glycerate hydrolase